MRECELKVPPFPFSPFQTRKELITAELLEIISTMSALGSKGGTIARTAFYE